MKRGLVIGEKGSSMMVQLENDEIVVVPEEEIGGEPTKKKVEKLIGAIVELEKTESGYSRKAALATRKKEAEETGIKVGDVVKCRPVVIFEGFIVVEACGEEVYIKIKDVTNDYTENLSDVVSYDEEYDAKVMEINPLKLSLKEMESGKKDHSMFEVGNQYFGVVKGTATMGTFVELPGKIQVLCYRNDWERQPQKGDKVIVEIVKKKEGGKEGVMGYLKRYIKKV